MATRSYEQVSLDANRLYDELDTTMRRLCERDDVDLFFRHRNILDKITFWNGYFVRRLRDSHAHRRRSPYCNSGGGGGGGMLDNVTVNGRYVWSRIGNGNSSSSSSSNITKRSYEKRFRNNRARTYTKVVSVSHDPTEEIDQLPLATMVIDDDDDDDDENDEGIDMSIVQQKKNDTNAAETNKANETFDNLTAVTMMREKKTTGAVNETSSPIDSFAPIAEDTDDDDDNIHSDTDVLEVQEHIDWNKL